MAIKRLLNGHQHDPLKAFKRAISMMKSYPFGPFKSMQAIDHRQSMHAFSNALKGF